WASDVLGKLDVTNTTIPSAGVLGRARAGGNSHALLKQHLTKSLWWWAALSSGAECADSWEYGTNT
ncbi:MAG: hypothetical protein QOI40_4367, partial [Alphaproteobacteria bacterium]|nr:hypothetical protein [Alphaproteobacteria bacterium]